MSDWMQKLPTHLLDEPLNCLAIPGSHDSFTYGIAKRAPVDPAESSAISSVVKVLGRLALYVIHNWALTQDQSFSDQLELGIRYFDLRVASKTKCEDCFFSHMQYGQTIVPCLKDMDTFLTEHPKEIVLLDFNHFYGMTPGLHENLISGILKVFGNKLCPIMNINDVTLNLMWKNKYQVLVFYQNPIVHNYNTLWSSASIYSLWVNTTKVDDLITGLEKAYEAGREKNIFYSYQGVRTPTTTTIILHLFGTLKNVFALKTAPAYVKWLRDKKAGRHGINICTMNFVTMKDYIPTVIALNK